MIFNIEKCYPYPYISAPTSPYSVMCLKTYELSYPDMIFIFVLITKSSYKILFYKIFKDYDQKLLEMLIYTPRKVGCIEKIST
jgi:hypothetical protein